MFTTPMILEYAKTKGANEHRTTFVAILMMYKWFFDATHSAPRAQKGTQDIAFTTTIYVMFMHYLTTPGTSLPDIHSDTCNVYTQDRIWKKAFSLAVIPWLLIAIASRA